MTRLETTDDRNTQQRGPGPPPRAGWLRRVYLTLRTEHTTPGKLAVAVGIGVFVGCSPFWGLHFALSMILGTLFRLNRMLVYAAANLANPLTAPPIIFFEVQLGSRIRTGHWLGLSIEELREVGLGGLSLDFLVGGLVLGFVLGVVAAAGTYAIARSSRVPDDYQQIVDEVVRRYLDISIRDAEGARARLLRNPIYHFLLEEAVFQDARRILHLGCGRGLAAAVAAHAADAQHKKPIYLGVDGHVRYVRAARQALADVPWAVFEHADLRDFDPPDADLVLLLDALRFLPPPSQDALLRRIGKALRPGSRVLIWEVDADAGFSYRAQVFREHLASRLWRRTHAIPRGYRRAEDLKNALVAQGFDVRDRTTLGGMPRARILLEAIHRSET